MKRPWRVIEQLRKLFPGKWTYDPECPVHEWHHEDGWYVYAVSAMAPRYDGDDDNFVTRYYRSDTREPVDLLNRELMAVAERINRGEIVISNEPVLATVSDGKIIVQAPASAVEMIWMEKLKLED